MIRPGAGIRDEGKYENVYFAAYPKSKRVSLRNSDDCHPLRRCCRPGGASASGAMENGFVCGPRRAGGGFPDLSFLHRRLACEAQVEPPGCYNLPRRARRTRRFKSKSFLPRRARRARRLRAKSVYHEGHEEHEVLRAKVYFTTKFTKGTKVKSEERLPRRARSFSGMKTFILCLA